MSLLVIVQDASTGNPITDAQFGTSSITPGAFTALNWGNGNYWVEIDANTNFCVLSDQYYILCTNSGSNFYMTVDLKKPVPKGW